MRNKDFELLAPAGNLEIFKGVIESGADAVYVGGSMFGARAYANNFTEEELLEAIDFAHLQPFRLEVVRTRRRVITSWSSSTVRSSTAPSYCSLSVSLRLPSHSMGSSI